MSDPWEEDEKSMELAIPGMALPGLRDLRVLFVALIEFDLMMGPVVYLNEISKGSSYIVKLQDFQTVSEVYAGVARADVDILTTPEDSIAVFRRPNEEDADLSTVLLISCIPGTDMAPIRTIGARALIKARGSPERIAQELANSLKEFQTGAQFFERSDGTQKIKILEESKIATALEFSFIKGMAMIDLDSKIADFRYFPRIFDERELEPQIVLNYLDLQFQELRHDSVTSLLFNSVTFVLSKVETSLTYFLLLVNEPDVSQINRLGDWLILTSNSLRNGWRFAESDDVLNTIEILNMAFTSNSPPKFVNNYIQTTINAKKLKPIVALDNFNEIDKPKYVTDEIWSSIKSIDGTRSILELAHDSGMKYFDYLRFLEWGKHRNIFEYLTK